MSRVKASLSKAVWTKRLKEGAREATITLWNKKIKHCPDFALTRVLVSVVSRKDDPDVRMGSFPDPDSIYLLKCSEQERVFLLLLSACSLPLQVCRKSCLFLRPGGCDADKRCRVCDTGEHETLSHFLFDCPVLDHLRCDDLRQLSANELSLQLRLEACSDGVRPLLTCVVGMWALRQSRTRELRKR